MSQQEDLLELLEARGERGLTAMESLSELGIMRLAARVKDLREAGHVIETRHVRTAKGKSIGCYVLVKPEPKPAFTEVGLWG